MSGSTDCNLLYNTWHLAAAPFQLKIHAFIHKESKGVVGWTEDWEMVRQNVHRLSLNAISL